MSYILVLIRNCHGSPIDHPFIPTEQEQLSWNFQLILFQLVYPTRLMTK